MQGRDHAGIAVQKRVPVHRLMLAEPLVQRIGVRTNKRIQQLAKAQANVEHSFLKQENTAQTRVGLWRLGTSEATPRLGTLRTGTRNAVC
jgi:hypothetical protein